MKMIFYDIGFLLKVFHAIVTNRRIKVKKFLLLVLLSISLLSCSLFQPYNNVDDVITSRMSAYSVAGISAVIVDSDGIAWENHYGYQDVEKSIPTSEETLFCIASISKLITGTAIMILKEDGLLALDEDINTYLPFTVRHPDYPSVPITIRMLMTHTSSIISDWEIIMETPELWDTWSTENPGSLDMHLIEEYITPGGIYYHAEKNFAPEQPGTSIYYSNEGITLLAYIVEEISGNDFAAFCQQQIFTPLLMRGNWSYDLIDNSKLSVSYDLDGNILGYIKGSCWPAGSFITTAHDFARFVQLFLNEGSVDGVEIMSPESVTEMLTPQNGEFCLVWGITEVTLAGRETIGHTGTLPGQRPFAYIDTETNEAIIVFTNSDWVYPYAVVDIFASLFLYAEELR